MFYKTDWFVSEEVSAQASSKLLSELILILKNKYLENKIENSYKEVLSSYMKYLTFEKSEVSVKCEIIDEKFF